jgi:exopolyphosphatase / guanosine-5'-triphosphate,3'-diphosphate pyrophosphatase
VLAAIDAGSNAIRMAIARREPDGRLIPLESDRAPVRLGHNTFTRGELDGKTVASAVAAFARFRRAFDRHGVTAYRAVATSALRNAHNREHLIDRLYRELDLELQVIDGEEEARLVRRAVLHAFGDHEPPAMIVDLGGGSLEVSERSQGEWITSSMKIGTVRLLETFGLSGPIGDAEARMVRRFVAAQLRTSLPEELWDPSTTTAAACGGNAEALASLFGDRDRTTGFPALKIGALEAALPGLVAADVAGRMKTYDVRQDRAEVMAVAALVFAALGQTLGLKRLVVPGVGLRDGVLLDLVESKGGRIEREAAALSAARSFSARLGHNTGHAELVRRLAARLFDALREPLGLPPRLGVILEAAALLHDLGEVIHRRSHHKHSEYLILNGRIPGLDDLERQMVAAIARAHRKSLPDRRHATFAGLPPGRQAEVRALVALLRVADALDTDHRQRIVDLAIEVKGKKVVLALTATRDGDPLRLTDMDRAGELEALLDRRLVFELSEVPRARASAARSE